VVKLPPLHPGAAFFCADGGNRRLRAFRERMMCAREMVRRKLPGFRGAQSGLRLLLHDPAASRPHDLDDPFFDAAVQRRVADVIAEAARKKSNE